PEDFRDNTTYILTIGTEFRDVGGNRLSDPISVAFSTGETIDQGEIAGRVVEPDRGDPVPDVDIYAYRETSASSELPSRPDFRTQTGTDGTFRFQHLSDDRFFVVALRDANRNRQPDPGEAVAVPPVEWITADSSGSPQPEPWVIAEIDTLAPQVTRARPLSDRRFELLFNEPVILSNRAPEAWVIEDSLSGQSYTPEAIYTRPAEERSIFVLADGPLPPHTHRIVTGAVADSSGNRADQLEAYVVPGALIDTLTTRFVNFIPDTSAAAEDVTELLGHQRPGVRFNAPPSDAQIAEWITVADTARTLAGIETADGTSYALTFDPELGLGERVTLIVETDRISRRQTFRRLDAGDLGEISGSVTGIDSLFAQPIVQLFEDNATSPLFTVRADSLGAFIFNGVPEGSYRLRAFQPARESNSWFPGRIAPYQRRAPIGWWNEAVNVRPRWETVLPDAVDLGQSSPRDSSSES
ncbi:MAG: Ig-like domain-containing domain, partial [Bacteroidota bacterium]